MLCHDALVKICYRCANICYVRIISICYVTVCYGMLTALCNNRCYVMTCYTVAGCYVNCVLGYDTICYVNMLHLLSCTFLQKKHF